jgi:hypothetical protein
MGNGLPIQPLATAPAVAVDTAGVSYVDIEAGHPDLFSRLCVVEDALEPYFFVQFADQSKDLQDLKAKWSAWWSANKGKAPEQWWRQAADQAAEELTHADWWHRMRAARRLTRLTGQAAIPPAVFDTGGWKAPQAAWRKKLQGDSSPRLWLLAEGVRAGVLPAGAEAHAADDAACLADLVKLAGFGPDPLAEAAMLQIQQHAPRDAVLKLANSWKHSPRRALAYWVWYESRPAQWISPAASPVNVNFNDDSGTNVNVPPGGE